MTVATAIPASDRRLARRLVTQLSVSYKLGACAGRALTADVSESGLFICTDEDAPLGSRILLKLNLTVGRTIRVIGEVARKTARGVPGLGVIFTGIRNDDRSALREFVNSRLPFRSSNVVAPKKDAGYVAPQPSFKLEWIPAGQEPEAALPEVEVIPFSSSAGGEATVDAIRRVGRNALGIGLILMPVAVVYWMVLKMGALIDALIGGF